LKSSWLFQLDPEQDEYVAKTLARFRMIISPTAREIDSIEIQAPKIKDRLWPAY
jgi:hypothetical protein